ncbi:transcriptional regulator [Methanococcus maripaludis]|uniref:DNA-binding HxlR family transcriptional regulator n=1 Tax=Methanococcus maripaludis TaxID=39152 RepID=A0A7J9PMS6_METMI|nr:transcriptional regulator [Methanococcus maripaludis]MBA2864026.1 DNA-binding HxlR family transcriptional regulator [Methanococcus maripaludis]
MFLKVLSKKNTKEVLYLLEKNEELYFSQILNETGAFKSNLSNLINELIDFGLISKREEAEELKQQKIPKVYYKLTNIGKEALKIYEIEENLEKLKTNNE